MHSKQMKSPIVPVALLVLFALCGALFANRAQAGEVHFDPESPAGKEYALPLQQARNEAIGTGGGEAGEGPGGSSGAAAPLFGVGVGSADGSGAASRSNDSGTRQGEDGSGTENPGGRGADAESSTEPNPSPAAVTAAENADYSTGTSLLLLAGILVFGVALGFALRAYGRHRPATG
jgi:hypothetical protein